MRILTGADARDAQPEGAAGQPFDVAVNYGESPTKVREYVRSQFVDFPVILYPSQEGARAWGCASSSSAS